MSEDLIARLKAAHEAADEIRGTYGLHKMVDGEWSTFTPSHVKVDALVAAIDNLPAAEIIAALEERERMREVVEAAQRVADWGWGADAPAECQTDFIDLRAALDALRGKP